MRYLHGTYNTGTILNTGIYNSVSNTATVSSSVVSYPAVNLDESTTVSATVSAGALAVAITETVATLAALSTGQQDITTSISEALSVTASLSKTLLGVVGIAEAVEVGESVSDIGDLVASITELVVATGAIESDLAISASVVVTVALIMAINAANTSADFTETVDVSDTLFHYVNYILAITNSATVGETMAESLDAVVTITNTVAASDSLSGNVSVTGSISEGLSVEVFIRFAGTNYDGWVVNSEGMFPSSKYTNWPFNSYAFIGNVTYALAETGLYKLTGSTDAGSEISSHILTGKMDFGSNLEKQVPDVQIGYTSSGTLRLYVRVYEDGEQKEYWYEMQEITAATPVTNDIYVGRGLISNYWQFKLINVDGSSFHLDNIRLYPVALSRRK